MSRKLFALVCCFVVFSFCFLNGCSGKKFKVTWTNYDGTILEVDKRVAEGTLPSYDGADPEKPGNEEHNYEFIGWSPEVSVVNQDVTYVAQYKEVVIQKLTFELSQSANYYKVSSLGTYYKGDIVIPETHKGLPVKEIGDNAFKGNVSIKSIEIPASIVMCSSHSFNGCFGMTAIYYRGTIEQWCNISFDSTYANPMCYAQEFYMLNSKNEWYEVKEIQIPNNFQKVRNFQFYGFNNVTTITLPDTLKEIGSFSFSSCSSLTSINLPDNLEKIGDQAFSSCKKLSSIKVPAKVASIGEAAFGNCTSLVSVTFDAGNTITELTKELFGGCSSLVSIEIPSTVTEIGYRAFKDCSALETVYYYGSIEKWCLIDFDSYESQPMSYAKSFLILDEENQWYEPEKIVIPEGIEAIGDYQFRGFKNITSIEISSGVKIIGEYAFASCQALTKIEIPASVTQIKQYAFDKNTALEDVYFTGTFEQWCLMERAVTKSNPMLEAESFYLLNQEAQWEELTKIVIPASITQLSHSQLRGFNHVTSVVVHENVTLIGAQCFDEYSSLEEITLPFNNETSCLYDYISDDIQYTEKLRKVTINKASIIPDYAFNQYRLIEIIELPNNITSIGVSAFSGCSNLKEIRIPKSVEIIKRGAFYNCDSVVIYCESEAKLEGWHEDWNSSNCPVYWGINDENFISINNYRYWIIDGKAELLRYVGSDEEVIIPSQIELNGNTYPVTKIKEKAFKKSLIKTIDFPDTITTIESEVFSYCIELVEVYLSQGLLTIGDNVFKKCEKIRIVYIPDSVETIGEFAIYTGRKILVVSQNLIIPEGWNTMWTDSSNVLYLGVEKENIVIKDDFAYILENDAATLAIYYGEDIFVVIPSSVLAKGKEYDVKIIGSKSISSNKTIASIEIPKTITEIRQDSFWNNPNLTEVIYQGSISEWCLIEHVNKWPNQIYLYLRGEDNQLQRVENLEIPDDISVIKSNTFYNVSSITSLKLSNNLTSIENYAFAECSSIQTIEFSSNLKNIGDYAFQNLSSTIEVHLPDGLETIGEYAFSSCDSLKIASIPSSVTQIGFAVFYHSNAMEKLSIPYIGKTLENEENSCFDYIFGRNQGTYNPIYTFVPSTLSEVEISAGRIVDSGFEGLTNIVKVKLGNNVTSIGKNAFARCSKLTSINFCDGIETIGESAFAHCVLLKEIELPTSIKKIEKNTFSSCDSLETVQFLEGLIEIGEKAFAYCSLLSEVNIPRTVTTIGNSAFTYCTSLKTILIPNSLTNIGYSIFANCSQLTDAVIEKGVTKVPASIFSQCYKLVSVTLPEGIKEIGSYAFSDCSKLSIISLPESLEIIGLSAFEECNSISKITIPDKVVEIGSSAFRGSPINLETLPNGLTKLGSYAFADCQRIESISIPNGIKKIESAVFYNCSNLVNVSLPEGLLEIDSSVFDRCTKIEEINIPNSVQKIGSCAFRECEKLQRINIPQGITAIESQTFSNCTSLTTIDIPDSVTKIGSYAFAFCSSLVEVNLSSSLTIIESYAFKDCVNLQNISLPSSLKQIGNYAFSNCTKLESIDINNEDVIIGEKAFSNCASLKKVNILKDISSLSINAFNGCSALEFNEYDNALYLGGDDNPYRILYKVKDSSVVNVTVANGTKIILENAFSNSEELRKVTLPEGLVEIQDMAFSNCSKLQEIFLPKSVRSVGIKAFYNCVSLRNLVIASEDVFIGSYSFSNCTNLQNVTILSTKIGMGEQNFQDSVFNKYEGLNYLGNIENPYLFLFSCTNKNALPENLVLHKDTKIINTDVFSNALNIKNVVLPEGLTTIWSRAFYRAKNIESIVIPSSLNYIGEDCFELCNKLQYNEYEGLKYLGNDENPYILLVDAHVNEETVVLHKDTKVIGPNAFSLFDNVKKVIIPMGVTMISRNAFYVGSGVTIYCEASSQPDTWDQGWNNLDLPVIFGEI